ncbi:MAG: TRAM domain-containing protein, partial [Clostridia bacterium]|nr:TRAM domain-containing protein [Clostridia bacterium]
MGKRKNLPLIENVTVTDVAAEGNALARVDNMVIFMPFGSPGDVVDVQIVKKRKQHALGRIV